MSSQKNMTQIESARLKKYTQEMKSVALSEEVPLSFLCQGIADGSIVLLKNKKRDIKPCGIGRGLRTKINANLGTSLDKANIRTELKKLKTAIKYGADTVMDLSTGGDIRTLRKIMLENCNIPLGTVPIYEAAIKASTKKGSILKMTKEDILNVFEEQAADGVDFFTVHCGVTQDTLTRLKRQKRVIDVVSRGGAFLIQWMVANKKENPLYEYFEDIIKIAKRYDITLSLGDGLRPGSVIDATDRPQFQELITLGELAEKARSSGVQIIIEGPGHMPVNQIESNVILEKKLCGNAPFYVLGPLVTDIAPGYDHITGAIGGAIAAFYGADFLCYVTPSEHLRIPDTNDVKEGVIASRIAAHAADIAKGIPQALEKDKRISQSRARRDWKRQIQLSIDPEKAWRYRKSSHPKSKDVCTMCSDFCSMKMMERCFGWTK